MSRVLGGLVFLTLLASADAAMACSCAFSGPPCQAFWSADAVLDATVVSMSPLERREDRTYPWDDTLVSLEVHAAPKGGSRGRLEITTHSQESACGYRFKAGNRYFIFARRAPDGSLSASRCSATREFDGTGPAAEFLASLHEPPRGGRVFGTVHTSLQSSSGTHTRTPLETSLRLSGGGGMRTLRTTAGLFEFTGLPVGSYRLDVDVPEGYSAFANWRDVQIADVRGCAEVDFTFVAAGRISGRVVDREGRPVARVTVELVSADAEPHPDHGFSPRTLPSDASGEFSFENLSPGRYVVGLNLNDLPSDFKPHGRTVYPGPPHEPAVIELALGQVVDLGSWYIPPPLPVLIVKGIVIRDDGTPAAGIYVGAWDVTGGASTRTRGAGGATSGADGRFELKLREGRSYTFIARGENNQWLRVRAPRIEAAAAAETTITIVVLGTR